jgi:alpha-glucosidase (family GH31 glycosyl hydrolase)
VGCARPRSARLFGLKRCAAETKTSRSKRATGRAGSLERTQDRIDRARRRQPHRDEHRLNLEAAETRAAYVLRDALERELTGAEIEHDLDARVLADLVKHVDSIADQVERSQDDGHVDRLGRCVAEKIALRDRSSIPDTMHGRRAHAGARVDADVPVAAPEHLVGEARIAAAQIEDECAGWQRRANGEHRLGAPPVVVSRVPVLGLAEALGDAVVLLVQVDHEREYAARTFALRWCIRPEGATLRISIALAIALVAAGAETAPRARGASPVSWQVTQTPFRLSILAGGVTRVSESDLSGGPGGRLSYRLADGSFHGLSNVIGSTPSGAGMTYQIATDEAGRTATVTLQPVKNGVSVALTLQPADGVVDTFESFAASPGEHFLGGGERPAALDLRGQSLAIKTAYSCSSTMPAPFFLSSAGYGVLVHGTTIASMAFPGATLADSCAGGPESQCPLAAHLSVAQICTKSASLSYDVLAGTLEQIVSAYTAEVGRPPVPPASQFALIKWRDIVSGPAELYEDVDQLHALKIPIGWVLLDNPWESGLCYGRMTFDTQRFPDPGGMIASLHARGVEFMLWISPLVRRQFCPPPPQYSQSALFGTGNAATIDLTDPATLSTFEQSVRSLIALGVDGFKADRGDEIDLEPLQLAGGPGLTLHNEYPLLYARAVAAAIQAAGKTASFATLFRAGAPGSAATVPGFWGGDQQGSFPGLAAAIRDGLSAGVAGYPVWGSDTGGFDSAALTPDVFVRWAQFSAVSPVFEVGGTGGNATFWNFGPETVAAFREAAVLHYELFPYLYSLAEAAHTGGLPIMRPLALEYPSDGQAWQHDLEVLVGRNLLAAPVTTPGSEAQVYLPAGSWLDLATGELRHGGGLPYVRPAPLDQLPLYLRKGAVIPFAARTPLLWRREWPVDALSLPGRGGWLYAPGEGAARAATPEFGSFRAVTQASTVRIRLRHAPSETQVLLTGRSAPSSVRIDGLVVRKSVSLAALRTAATGWTTTTAPFPGVVLKLTPHSGAAQVELVLAQPR